MAAATRPTAAMRAAATIMGATTIRPAATMGPATAIRSTATVGLATSVRSAATVEPATIAESPVSAIVEATVPAVTESLAAAETPMIVVSAAASKIITVPETSASKIIAVPEPSTSKVVAVSKSPVVAPETPESIATEPVFMEAYKFAMEAKATVHIKGPVEASMRVVEVVPGPRADEDTVREPFRAVVSVRRAAEWISGIKPVLAHRRRIVNAVTRPYLYADCNLCL